MNFGTAQPFRYKKREFCFVAERLRRSEAFVKPSVLRAEIRRTHGRKVSRRERRSPHKQDTHPRAASLFSAFESEAENAGYKFSCFGERSRGLFAVSGSPRLRRSVARLEALDFSISAEPETPDGPDDSRRWVDFEFCHCFVRDDTRDERILFLVAGILRFYTGPVTVAFVRAPQQFSGARPDSRRRDS